VADKKMQNGKIVYLSGKITDNADYKKDFKCAEHFLSQMGYIVINPAELEEVAEGLTYEQYMQICYRLIDISDIIFMVSGWQNSKGANAELTYAKSLGKKTMYQEYYHQFRKGSESEEIGDSN
jgi:hypothetical protein